MNVLLTSITSQQPAISNVSIVYCSLLPEHCKSSLRQTRTADLYIISVAL